jgi:hypothetical protein
LAIFWAKSRQGVSKNSQNFVKVSCLVIDATNNPRSLSHHLFFHARDALHKHKASPASLQASLAGLALNRWLAYSPAVVLQTS